MYIPTKSIKKPTLNITPIHFSSVVGSLFKRLITAKIKPTKLAKNVALRTPIKNTQNFLGDGAV